MNTRELSDLCHDMLQLPELERATLARDLVASLDGLADPDVHTAWNMEICRRINEIEAGNAVLLDPEDVLRAARERLNKY